MCSIRVLHRVHTHKWEERNEEKNADDGSENLLLYALKIDFSKINTV